MNKVFLIGKVISNVNFNFIINSKHNSIARFNIKSLNGQIINIIAYDSLADFVYSKVNLDNLVFIYGYLNEKGVVVKELKKLQIFN